MYVLTDENFSTETAKGNVLVDFYADWCGPCQMVAPILEQLDEEVDNVKIVKVDVDVSAQTTMQFGIRSIPTLVFLKDGKELDSISGAPSKQMLLQKIDSLFNEGS